MEQKAITARGVPWRPLPPRARMSAPELSCECCAAGGCPHAASRSLWERVARHGHAIQVVADPGAPEAFMYTVGADPEFLVEDVPVCVVNDVGSMLNLLVERVRSGHPVRDGHTIGALGLVFEASLLQGAELRQALARRCLACSSTSQVVLLELVGRQCEQCDRAGKVGASDS